jgi:hypothetical protein
VQAEQSIKKTAYLLANASKDSALCGNNFSIRQSQKQPGLTSIFYSCRATSIGILSTGKPGVERRFTPGWNEGLHSGPDFPMSVTT